MLKAIANLDIQYNNIWTYLLVNFISNIYKKYLLTPWSEWTFLLISTYLQKSQMEPFSILCRKWAYNYIDSLILRSE